MINLKIKHCKPFQLPLGKLELLMCFHNHKEQNHLYHFSEYFQPTSKSLVQKKIKNTMALVLKCNCL